MAEVNCAHLSWALTPHNGMGGHMERIRFITYKEQRVLLVDVSDCTPEDVADCADRVPDVVTREPIGSVLLLADFSRAQFTRDSVEHLKIAAVFDRPHLKKSAWVFTENLPKALFDSVRSFSGREIPNFATREEALDYLTS